MMHKSGRNDIQKPGASCKTLADYIALKQESDSFFKKNSKLTFAEWYPINKSKIGFDYESAHIVWKAAQENV